jgi:hypothetical protein
MRRAVKSAFSPPGSGKPFLDNGNLNFYDAVTIVLMGKTATYRGDGMHCREQVKSRRWAAVSLMIAALFALAGCAAPVTLTGTVTDAYSGAPLAGVLISTGRTQVVTDEAGSFSTNAWSAERPLELIAADYERASVTLAGLPGVGQSGTLTVTVTPSLRPNTLAGTVRDAYTQQALPGVALAVSLSDGTVISTTSDAEGAYKLSGVPADFTLQAQLDGYSAADEALSKQVAFDVVLRPNTLSGSVQDLYSKSPVSGVKVKAGSAEVTTAADGTYQLRDIPADAAEVTFSADGYAVFTASLAQVTSLDAVLRPNTLVGRLIDAATGQPVTNAAIVAAESADTVPTAFVRMIDSADGSFSLEGLPEAGVIQILAPGYREKVLEITPGNLSSEIALEPFYTRGVYITAAVASVPRLVDRFLDLIDQTELNTLVVDIKSDLRDDLGLVYYESKVPLAVENNLSRPIVDFSYIISEARKRGIYTVARVQLFSHDNVLSDAFPEWSIRLKSTGEVYADYPGPGIRYAYLDPTNRNVWDYNIALGVEAAQMGFDEINYDYIRFPDWFGTKQEFTDKLLFSEPIDAVNNPDRMFEVILEFMDLAHDAVNGAGAFMSIDTFGRTVLGPSLTIAQDIKRMGDHTDYVMPMPYPSLWWGGFENIAVPVEQPYETLRLAVQKGGEQMAETYGLQRPWLQDHTDPWSPVVVEYGPAEVRAQIDATEEQPEAAAGWILYDSANMYAGANGGAVRPGGD